jgi:aspartate/methionine/tyrosine aminotransferase
VNFPEYKLVKFQAENARRGKYFMGASGPEAISLQELLSMASDEDRQRWQGFSLGFAPSLGDEQLRELIAADYPGLAADNIITFAGAQEAIYATYHALLNAGDRVQVITPVFEPLSIVAEFIGARVNRVQMKSTDACWQLDMDRWFDAQHPDTRLSVINFPHNPTGAMISKLQLQMIVDQCRDFDGWLFSDEVFRGLEYRDADRLPPAASVYEKAISLGVMSKAYGLGGVRIGWIACQDKQLIQRLHEIKQYLSICNSRADEVLASIALKNRQKLLSQNRDIILNNLGIIEAAAGQFSSRIEWYRPMAGCVAFPRVKNTSSSNDFVEEVLDKTGVLLVPGECFQQGSGHVRLGFGGSGFAYHFSRLASVW